MPVTEKPAPKAFDHVVVVWEDASTIPEMQVNSPEEALRDYTPAIRRTSGLFCAQTEQITIVGSEDDRDPQHKNAMGGMSFIPTSLVRQLRVVKRDKVKVTK